VIGRLLGATLAGAAAAASLFAAAAPAGAQDGAPSQPFTRPLFVPPVLTGANVKIPIREADVPLLPGRPTRMWTYGGTFPGPTIRRPAGEPLRVTFDHQLPAAGPLSTHLHGGHNHTTQDGQAHAFPIAPGTSKQYRYALEEDGHPERAAFQWYHDHREATTARNVYNGLAGMMIVDDAVEAKLPLPRGEFDLPLMVVDRSLTKDNQLRYDGLVETGNPVPDSSPEMRPPNDHVVGDRILVNGRFQPFHEVAARRYRVRILNAAQFSFYNLHLSDDAEMVQIATESGLLPRPVRRRKILIGPGERAEVVIDFAGKLGQEVVLESVGRDDLTPGAADAQSAPLMQFRVTRTAPDDSSVPDQLRPAPQLDPPPGISRQWSFGLTTDPRTGRQAWGVNGRVFDHERYDADPKLGSTETWQYTNTTNVTHTIHNHDVDFLLLSRNGRPPEPWEAGLKETFRVDPGESVIVAARFPDYTGDFMLHCHMLEHEDNGMMTHFRVVGAGGKEPPPEIPYREEGAAGPGGTAPDRRRARRTARRRGPSLGLPSDRRCRRTNRLAFRLKAPRGQRLRSARVLVNGKRVRTLRGRALRGRMVLRGLPRRARVTVVATTRSGRRIVVRRTYRRCPRTRAPKARLSLFCPLLDRKETA